MDCTKNLFFTKVDLDRAPKDVFGKQPDLVDAHTFARVYKLYRDSNNLIQLEKIKTTLVHCLAMDIMRYSMGTLRVRLDEYARYGGIKYTGIATPKFPHQGGDLIEWLGSFTLSQLVAVGAHGGWNTLLSHPFSFEEK